LKNNFNMAGFEDDFGEMVGGKSDGDLLTNEERASDLLTNEDPAAEFLAREQEELGDLETEIGPLSVSPPKAATLPPVEKKVREEPAVIKEWREQQMEKLRKKDEEEENARNRLRDQAAQELSDWYAANTIQLEKLRTSNRAAMENMDRTFVSQIEPLQPGTEWERVSKLCDFNPKTTKTVKDVSRMRSIILQLKSGPAPASV